MKHVVRAIIAALAVGALGVGFGASAASAEPVEVGCDSSTPVLVPIVQLFDSVCIG
ncbi:MAG: hypothetical protein QOF60_1934 [Actinomycetota bacterium]|jgi:hypothetical protein|nr:hypothetical protein [Actinomycetota bacterium]